MTQPTHTIPTAPDYASTIVGAVQPPLPSRAAARLFRTPSIIRFMEVVLSKAEPFIMKGGAG